MDYFRGLESVVLKSYDDDVVTLIRAASLLVIFVLCSDIFYGASKFNADISLWNVGRVTYME